MNILRCIMTKFLTKIVIFLFIIIILNGNILYKTYSQDVKTDGNEEQPLKENNKNGIIQNEKKVPPQEIRINSDQESIIKNIKISTDIDIMLWLSNLGLSFQGDRKEQEKQLLEYYKIPQNAFNKLALDKKKKEEEIVKKKKHEVPKDEKKEDKLVKEDVYDSETSRGVANEIIIKNAEKAQYFTYEKVNENVFTLNGKIEIWIVQRSKKKLHIISADKLVYNEALRIGSAIGNVYYEIFDHSGDKTPSTRPVNSVEKFSGEVISFSIDDFNADILRGAAYSSKSVKYGKNKSLKEELNFYIYSPHVSKSKDDIVVVSNASLTSNEVVPPLYTIKLKRMWLLAPNEWAISRASIFIGSIPVIWLPFFVNPGDKFFFRPGIGYKTRNGGYINTTTYIIGSPSKSERSEFLDIFNISGRKARRKIIKGLYLREIEEGDKIKTYPSGWSLKYILDYYTTVGIYSALEGKFSNLWKFENVAFKGSIAFSETVFDNNGLYFNNYVDKEGKIKRNTDKGVIFNMRVPFRYEFLFKANVRFGSLYNSSVLFEQYSDSFMSRDFGQRVLDFDWQQVIDPTQGEKDLKSRPSQKTGYYWQWDSNLVLPTQEWFGNYISNFSVSNFILKMNWKRKNMTTDSQPEAYFLGSGNIEERIEGYFFHPSQVSVPSYQLRTGGTLLSIDSENIYLDNGISATRWRRNQKKDNKQTEITDQDKNKVDKVLGEASNGDTTVSTDQDKNKVDKVLGEASNGDTTVSTDQDKNKVDKVLGEASNGDTTVSTDQDKNKVDKVLGEASNGDTIVSTDQDKNKIDSYTVFASPFRLEESNIKKQDEGVDIKEDESGFVRPQESFVVPNASPFNFSRITYKIDYSVSHVLEHIMFLNTNKWNRPEDIRVFTDDFIQYGQATTNNRFSLTQNVSFLNEMVSYTYALHFQLNRRVINNANTLAEKEKNTKGKSALNYTTEELSNSHNFVVSPLKMFSVFSGSTISYVANFDIGKDVLNTKKTATWYVFDNEEWWNGHSITQTYVAQYAGITNTLSLGVELPPYDTSYSPSYTLGVGSYFTFGSSTRITKNKEKEKYFYTPLSMNARFNLLENNISFTQDVKYNYENAYVDSTYSDLKLWWFSLSLSSLYSQKNVLNFNTFSFKPEGGKLLRPSVLSFIVNYKTKDIKFWKNRISFTFNVNMNYKHDFLKFTNSKFTMSYQFNFTIYQILTLVFSAAIKNDVVFLYYDEYAQQAGIRKRSLWKDIVDGFYFTDQNKLKDSAFKLEKLSLQFLQDFGGWVLNFGYSGSPRRVFENNRVKFEWKNTLEISVFWKPIGDLKSTAYFKNKTWSLKE